MAAESTEYTKKWFVTIRGSPEPRLAIGKLINQAWLRKRVGLLGMGAVTVYSLTLFSFENSNWQSQS